MENKESQDVQPALSIVIVTWNAKKVSLECLESVSKLESSIQTEVIVVDNASTDGTPEAIESGFPQVKLIRNDANLGFAKANNIGIDASKGKYVCLLNSDVVIPIGCFEKMVTYMEHHPDIGVLGPKMISPDGGVGKSVAKFPTVWNSFCCALAFHKVFKQSATFGGYMMEGFPYDRIEDVEVLTGWFWLVPRCALEQVGGLEERFFMYGEDIDWCYRFHKAGWRVVFYPEAEALHYGAASSGQAPTRFYVEMQRANEQYFRIHHGRLSELGYIAARSIHEVVRLLGYGVLYFTSSKSRSRAALMVARSLACLSFLTGISTISAQPIKRLR
jgi:GT2 family glycosyltransferase